MGMVTGIPDGVTVIGKQPEPGESAEYVSNMFQTAHKVIFDVLEMSVKGKAAEYIDIAYTLGKFGVQLYILWYVMTTLAGKQKDPVQDFIWNIVKFSVILMVVRNLDGWLDAVVNAVYGLKTTFAGGDVYVWLDELWTKTVAVAKKIYELDKSDYVPAAGALGAMLTYLGGLLALLAAAITFFAAEITLLLLTVTAPLFIMCLMFGFLRQMFNSWLQLIFGSLLIFLFAGLAIRAGIGYFNTILSSSVATAPEQNLIYMGAAGLAGGVLMAFIVWQAKTYASQIAGVCAEGALQGAAMMGLSVAGFGGGAMAGRAMSAGRAAGGKGAGLAWDATKKWATAPSAAAPAAEAAVSIGQQVAKTYKNMYGG